MQAYFLKWPMQYLLRLSGWNTQILAGKHVYFWDQPTFEPLQCSLCFEVGTINGSCCFLHFTYKMKVLTKCMSDATTTDLTWKAAKAPQKSDSSCHMEQQICASSTAQRGTATHHPTLLMQLNAHAFHYEIKPFSYIQMDTLHKFVFNKLSQGTAVS